MAGGQAHAAWADGGEPRWAGDLERDDGYGPEAWGWRELAQAGGDGDGTDGTVYRPLGGRVGWLDRAELYLDADAAYAVVQKLARDQGDALPVTLATLKRRLREQGILVSTERRGNRDRLEVRRTLQGVRREVLHLRAVTLLSLEVAQVAPVSHGGESEERPFTNEALTGPPNWATNAPGVPDVAQESGPAGGDATNDPQPVGPRGPHGPLARDGHASGVPGDDGWEEIA
jgi:hypothetical protein